MSKRISTFVSQNFHLDLAANLGLVGKQRISVQFKIDKEGKIVNVRARAPHPRLEEETIRVVSAMPKAIKPGYQKGKAVGVLYSLPITFEVKESAKEKRKRSKRERKKK